MTQFKQWPQIVSNGIDYVWQELATKEADLQRREQEMAARNLAGLLHVDWFL